MAQKTQIEFQTVELEKETMERIRTLNAQLNQIISTVGQLHLRRGELEEQLELVTERVTATEAEFKTTNGELRTILNGLEQKYPAGQIDLDSGTVTYRPESTDSK